MQVTLKRLVPALKSTVGIPDWGTFALHVLELPNAYTQPGKPSQTIYLAAEALSCRTSCSGSSQSARGTETKIPLIGLQSNHPFGVIPLIAKELQGTPYVCIHPFVENLCSARALYNARRSRHTHDEVPLAAMCHGLQICKTRRSARQTQRGASQTSFLNSFRVQE